MAMPVSVDDVSPPSLELFSSVVTDDSSMGVELSSITTEDYSVKAELSSRFIEDSSS